MIENRCLKRSLLIYAMCRFLHLKGDFKVNILLRCRDHHSDWGHAWVTRNGKMFLEKKRKLLPDPIRQVGNTEKFRYWVWDDKERN